MKIDFIPFQLGEQYENWEFDLEPVYDVLNYDKYHYLKKDIKSILEIPIENIYLTFCLDILFEVEYQIRVKYFQQLISKLIDNLSAGIYRAFDDRLEWENTKICIIVEIPRKSENVVFRVIDKNYYLDI